MKKKASLNISVQAIVVLILAITMLGLGLTFIRKFFGGTMEQFGEVSKQIEEQVKEDLKDNPGRISFYKTSLEVKQSSSENMYFGIRNDLPDEDGDGGETFTLIDESGSIDVDDKIGRWSSGSVIACFDALGVDEDDDGISGTNSNDDYVRFSTSETRFLKKDEVVVLTLKVTASPSAPKTLYSCAMVIEDPSGDGKMYERMDFDVEVV